MLMQRARPQIKVTIYPVVENCPKKSSRASNLVPVCEKNDSITGSCKLIVRPKAYQEAGFSSKSYSENASILLREGQACLIPACLADYDLIPCHPNTRILETHLDRKNRSLLAKIRRALKISRK